MVVRNPDVAWRAPARAPRVPIAVALVFVAVVNPWMAEHWWLRRPYVPEWIAALLLAVDLLVVVAAAAASRPAPGPSETTPVGRVLLVVGGAMVAAATAEAVFQLHPSWALPMSLRRELGWRAKHARARWEPTARDVDRYSRALGWELRPGLRTADVTSNARGVRGTRAYAVPPPPGVRRVVCVGDSFVFGEHLADAETMPARLEDELGAPWEVLNLGVHGYGTDQQWLRLRRLGFAYEPDVVIVGFLEDDLERNVLSFRDFAKPYFVVGHGHALRRNVPVPSPASVLAHPPAIPRWLLPVFLGTLPETFGVALAPAGDLAATRAGRVTVAILDGIRRDVARHAARLLVVVIPRPVTARPSDTERLLVAWGARTATPVAVLRLGYLALSPTDRARLYAGHWTAFGAAETARLVAPDVRRVAGL